MIKLKTFKLNNQITPVQYLETITVPTNEYCHVYKFVDHPECDLGIIEIKPNGKTPLQKILQGDQTIEGYISGQGDLIITKLDGNQVCYPVNKNTPDFQYSVQLGELMQWQANANTPLVVYEICYPPYQDGRYENL